MRSPSYVRSLSSPGLGVTLLALVALAAFWPNWSGRLVVDFTAGDLEADTAVGSMPMPVDSSKGMELRQSERVALPVGLRAAVQSAMEKDDYEIRRSGLHAPVPGSHQARNRAQKLRFGFSGRGVHVRPQRTGDGRADWELQMSLCGIGYDDILQTVGEGRPETSGNRLESQRVTATGKSFTEWYVNTPQGLEQGFTLPSRPSARRNPEDPLRVEFKVSGSVQPNLVEGRKSVTFTTAAHQQVLFYHGLHVYDASGTELPAHMRVDEDRLALVVDDRSAVYPLTVDPSFSAQAKLTADDGALEDRFGVSVALDGCTTLVGAYLDDDGASDAGSAYVFVRSSSGWTQQTKLLAADPLALARFGYSVALSGDTAVVGAIEAATSESRNGAAYVFVHSGTTWTPQAKLTADDGAFRDLFGASVAVDGDTVVVGASLDDDGAEDAGSAYVFVRSGTTWSQQTKLRAEFPAKEDFFGISVALSGDTALVGAWQADPGSKAASGLVDVFVRSGTTWTRQGTLTPDDAAAGDFFGFSVQVSGDHAVIGAPGDDDGASDAGSAYVFVRSGTTWSQQTKLLPGSPGAQDFFGFKVAIDGAAAVVGAFRDDGAGTDAGVAYVFLRSGTSWSPGPVLRPADTAAGDFFGGGVALSRGSALVGASAKNGGTGAAYVFTTTDDPATLLQGLIDQVEAVNQANNITNSSLDAKLEAAAQALSDLNNNNDAAAISTLDAFIQAVQAQSGKSISVADADALIADAGQIIDLLACR